MHEAGFGRFAEIFLFIVLVLFQAGCERNNRSAELGRIVQVDPDLINISQKARDSNGSSAGLVLWKAQFGPLGTCFLAT